MSRKSHFYLLAIVGLLVGGVITVINLTNQQDIRGRANTTANYPTVPPAQICGNASILDGPDTAPTGATIIPAGDNWDFFLNLSYEANRTAASGKTYWFAPGTHTLGNGEFNQIIPPDNSTFIGAPGAVLDGRGLNRYAFSQPANGVTIKHLTIKNFITPSNEGAVNGAAGSNWTIENNTISNNGGAGVFIGNNAIVRNNCLTNNGAYGLSGYKPQVPGSSAINNIVIDRNEFSYNDRDRIGLNDPSCGCSGAMKFWDVKDAKVTNNWVHHNNYAGIWADTNNIGFLIENNYVNDNWGEGIYYEISYNFVIRNNTLIRNSHGKGQVFAGRNDNFPVAAIYISEAGGDTRAGENYSASEISGNYLEDNWGGIVLWEAADRFCNSIANTSTGYCTKVNPDVSHATCSPGTIENEPYYSDCRWKTQNITVKNNELHINKANIPNCTGALSCGHSGIFSNYGVTHPYTGAVIAEAITFNRNNHFSNNNYNGNWKFTAYDQGRKLSFTQWQDAPYRQDAGSTITGTTSEPVPTAATPSSPVASPSITPTGTVSNGPSAPTNLRSTSMTVSQVNLSWDASIAGEAQINGYDVLRNGTSIGTTGGTSISDTNVVPGTTYTYTVYAYDAAFNHSPLSQPLSITIANPSATPSIVLTPTNTSPTPAISQAGTGLALDLLLHGLGKGGDSSNPSSEGTANPNRTQRNITVEVFNAQNQLVLTKAGVVGFNASSGNFLGVIDVGSLSTDVYTVKVKSDQFLKKVVPGIQTLTQGQINNLPQTTLVTGDMNNDNKIDIIDYTTLLDCFSDISPAKDCTDLSKKLSADLTDDGVVNQFDYNLFLRELTNIRGE